MIMSSTQPIKPNLFFVHLAGARPRIGEIVTPGVYFYLFYYLTFLLTCIVRRGNVVNGS